MNEEAGMSAYIDHMKNHRLYKKSVSSLKRELTSRDLSDSFPEIMEYAATTNTGLKHIKDRLYLHKNLEQKVLNTTFLTERADFRPYNARSKSTFGNPNRKDKFDRKLY